MNKGYQLNEADVKYLLNLARKYHRSMRLPLNEKEDRVQNAVTAVIRLATRYTGRAPFMAVAAIRLRYEIIDQAKFWKRKQGRGFNVTLASGPLNTNRIFDKHDYFDGVDASEFINTMLSEIKNRRLRCIFGLMASGMTQESAAITAGLSPSRVCQLMKTYFKPLAKRLMERKVSA